MTMAGDPVHSGGCLCGAVRYRVVAGDSRPPPPQQPQAQRQYTVTVGGTLHTLAPGADRAAKGWIMTNDEIRMTKE